MSAQVIDFLEKRREKIKKKAEEKADEYLQTDITQLTAEQLEQFSLELRQHIIQSADHVQPCSYDPSKVTVTIDGMQYIV